MTQLHSALGTPTTVRSLSADRRSLSLSGNAWRRRYQFSLAATDSVLILGVLLLTVNLLTLDAGVARMADVLGLGAAVAAGWIAMMAAMRTRDSRLVGTGAGESSQRRR